MKSGRFFLFHKKHPLLFSFFIATGWVPHLEKKKPTIELYRGEEQDLARRKRNKKIRLIRIIQPDSKKLTRPRQNNGLFTFSCNNAKSTTCLISLT